MKLEARRKLFEEKKNDLKQKVEAGKEKIKEDIEKLKNH